jgi:hypothetical protein
VLKLLDGSGDLEQALVVARASKPEAAGRQCELYFYAAQKAWIDGDANLARQLLKQALDTGSNESVEHGLARRLLDRLDGK